MSILGSESLRYPSLSLLILQSPRVARTSRECSAKAKTSLKVFGKLPCIGSVKVLGSKGCSDSSFL